MKNLKKLGAIVLALVMVLSLSTVAFADNELAIAGDPAAATLNATFESQIKTDDPSNTPKTAFTYTISNGAAVDQTINAGVTGGLKFLKTEGTDQVVTGDVTVKVPFAVNDAEKAETVTLQAVAGAFTSAGIYRYTITQSDLSAAQTAAGFSADKDPVKSVDVYVAKAPEGQSGFLITAIILSQNGETIDISGTTSTHATKVTAFENGFGKKDDPDPTDPDTDPTYTNATITITKVVTGNMGDTNMPFPFIINVDDFADKDADTSYEGLKVTLTKPDGSTSEIVVGTAVTEPNVTLANGQSATIVLPKGAVLKVKENLDGTEGYVIKAEETTSTLAAKTFTADGTNTVTDAGSTATIGEENATITYTNNRDAISPTGVVLTFAPYFFMMAAAIVLVLFTRRREEEQA